MALRAMRLPTTLREAICSQLIHRSTICCAAWSAPALSPKALNPLRERLEASAIALVDRLVERGSFDAVTDFAQYLPVSIVSELVGLPEEGRHNMLRWAEATFNQLGGENARTVAARPITQEMREYTLTATPDKLRPGSWAAMLDEAASRA